MQVGDGHGHDRAGHADEGDDQGGAGQPAAAGVAHDGAVGGDVVEEPDQRDGDDAVEDRGEYQGVDGVDAGEVQAQADDHGRGDDPVEVPALLRLEVQALGLAPGLGQRVGGGPGHHRDGEHAEGDDAEGEQGLGDLAGVGEGLDQRFEHPGRVGRRVDGGDVGGVQHRGPDDDDEPGHGLGDEHADGVVGAQVAQRAPGLAAGVLFDLLGGLPEEHVRRDGGADDRGDDVEERGRELDVRDEGGPEDLTPGFGDQQRGDRVGQQRDRQPLEYFGVPAVADGDLPGEDQSGEADHQDRDRDM